VSRGNREMTIPGFTAESALYNNSEHKRILGTPPPAVMSWAIQPARTFVREPEKDGQGQFGVEVGGPAPAMGGCWYGNWCGPGCGSGNPIDNLDECCMAHDLCYDARGIGACSCDLELVGCALPKQFEVWRPLKSIAAGHIVGLFTAKVTSGACPSERGTGGTGGGPGFGAGPRGSGAGGVTEPPIHQK
jgi:hypothetical protein